MSKLPIPIITICTIVAINAATVVIGSGAMIYGSALNSIQSSSVNVEAQGVEAFNDQFMSYNGIQQGRQISSLIGRLIANCSTYSYESEKVPNVDFVNEDGSKSIEAVYRSEADKDTYLERLAEMRDSLEGNHTYLVNFVYSSNGLIDTISINY